jgi:hypothetical protein
MELWECPESLAVDLGFKAQLTLYILETAFLIEGCSIG